MTYQFEPVWGDPPPNNGKGPNRELDQALDRFVQSMRERPGEWAELPGIEGEEGHPNSRATKLKKSYQYLNVETRGIPGSKTRRRIWVRVPAGRADG